jgi:carbonic anhydrase
MIRKITAFAALAAGTILLGTALASSTGPGITADEALSKLMDGNKRYVENQMTGVKTCDVNARKRLSTGQAPYAIILSCSDSRVPPELLFDEGLGEIFVVRVAGNVVDPVVLGSVEYAAEHLGTQLVMVLGHERCGAVKATVDSKGKGEGNIGKIVKAIAPALKSTKAKKDKAEFVEAVVDENIKLVKGNLTKQSTVLAHLVKKGKLKVVAAKYDLDDGTVTVMNK